MTVSRPAIAASGAPVWGIRKSADVVAQAAHAVAISAKALMDILQPNAQSGRRFHHPA
jgi:hypothetical protein